MVLMVAVVFLLGVVVVVAVVRVDVVLEVPVFVVQILLSFKNLLLVNLVVFFLYNQAKIKTKIHI